jgi:hypothetical protein
MTKHPCKKSGIEISEAADGFVVHDAVRDRVHYLNRSAALILELCDGRTDAESITAILQEAYELPEPPTDLVKSYLDRLIEEQLVEPAS